MACSVTITDFLEVTPGTLRVVGTAVDCTAVRLQTSCGAPQQQPIPVDANGNWQADFPNAEQCRCDERDYFVSAWCDGDTGCIDQRRMLLRCPGSTTTTTTTSTTTTTTTTTRPPACYTVTIATPQCSCAQGATPAGCTFTATVTPVGSAPPYTGSYRWKIFRTVNGAPQLPPLYNQPLTGANANVVSVGNLASGNYEVEVILDTPDCPDGDASYPRGFAVFSCDCPTISGGLQATSDQDDPCTWHFNVQVNNPTGNVALEFEWDFDGDGTIDVSTTTPWVSHTYTTSGRRTVTVNAKVPGRPECMDSALTQIDVDCNGGPTTTTTTTTPGPTTTGSPTTTPTPTTPSAPPPPPSGGGCLCDLLLILALFFIAVGAIALLVWACTNYAYWPLLVVGIVAAVLGIVLLVIWILVCAASQCQALFILIDIFTILVVVSPIVAAILALTGQGACGVGALIDWGIFGIILGLLYRLGELVGCITRNP